MTPTKLLTVEEFIQIPDPPSGRYELRHGEVILVPPAKKGHANAQTRIRRVLERFCTGRYVDKKFAFRPLPEYEVWEADIGMVSEERWNSTDDQSWFAGVPDLIVEIISPSNTIQEMIDRENICFQGGCKEFWLLDPASHTIQVTTPDHQSRTYTVNDEISLNRFASANLKVAEVFVQ